MKTLVWQGCYDDSWKGVIPAAAFEHPAKFSKRLVERILEHMEERGWIDREAQPVIADPFGGVRTGGVICAYRGYRWLGVELEQRFMDLGDQVFELHRQRWDRLGVPQPVCVRGDSRRFDEILKEAGAVISSPPYISGGHHTDVFDAWNKNGGGQNAQPTGYGKTDGQISQLQEGQVEAVVTSPVYSGNDKSDYNKQGRRSAKDKCAFGGSETYGQSAGQIGTLKTGEVDAVVTSSPFLCARSGTTESAGGIATAGYVGEKRSEPAMSKRTYKSGTDVHRTEDNIESCAPGDVDAVITSPSFGNTEGAMRSGKFKNPDDALQAKRGKGCSDAARRRQLKRDERKVMPHSDGQIDGARMGKVDVVISSPPYDDIAAGAGGLNSKPPTRPGQQAGRRKGPSQGGDQRYGKTEGQISRARKGKVDVVISSPPYEDSLRAKEHGFDFAKAKPDYPGRVEHAERVAQHDKAHGNRRYGDEPGQIGKLKKQTYWEAMAEVYSATFRALKAGGVMAIVVKDFVKAGKRQRLCDDTLKLLKHIGFLPLERVRAMLIEDWVAPDLFEGTTTKRKTRKSFFRRHLESKLAADDPRRIDWEEVLFVRKPV